MMDQAALKRSQPAQLMIPIKIQCGCGQKYVFDVEPAGGRMAYAVQCPACGVDGTAAANQVIAQHLAAQSAGAATNGTRLCLSDQPQRLETRPASDAKTRSDSTFQPAAARAPHTAALRQRPRRERATPVLPAIVGVVTVVLVAAVFFGRSHSRNYQPSNAVAVVDYSLPHTLAELNAWYIEPPAGQNAATFYLDGFDVLQIGNVGSSSLPLLGKGALPPLGSPMPAVMKSALSAIVHSNQEALRLFAAGASYEQSRYPLDLTRGFETVFPHLPKVKSATLIAEVSAILHAEANDGKQAAKDVLIALALARSLEAEPSLFSQKMRAITVSITVAALEQTVNRTSLCRDSLSDLSSAFHKMEDYDARGEGFNRALAAELITTVALLATPQKLLEFLPAPGVDMPAELRNQIVARLEKAKNLKEEQQYYEETFQQLMAIRKAALPDRLKAADLIRQRVTKAADKKLAIIAWLLPGLAGDAAKEASCLASLRLGLTGLALEQFRAAHDNRYPDALTELTPDYSTSTPVDPFDGLPLRYRKKGGGYLLYSIGPNLKDDSGERMNGKEGDIVFAVVTPSAK
jgi:hypothetical protein